MAVFIERNEIRNAHNLPEARQVNQGIEFGMSVRIKLNVMGIGTAVIMRNSKLADRILREDAAGLATNKIVDAHHDVVPSRRLKRRIVDILDELGNLLRSAHGTNPSR
jgi:hypothetical protein